MMKDLASDSVVNLYRESDTTFSKPIGSGVVLKGESVLRLQVNVDRSLDDGDEMLVAKVRGLDGTLKTLTIKVKIDSTPPEAPTLALEGGGTSEGKTYTKKQNGFVIVFSDLASDAADRKQIYGRKLGDLNPLQLLKGVVDGDKMIITDPLFDGDGEYELEGLVFDHAGNEGERGSLRLVIDNVAPAKPVLEAKGSPISFPTFTVSNLEVGVRVLLYKKEGGNDVLIGEGVAKSQTMDVISTFSFPLGEGTVYAKTVDFAGNESAASDELTFSVIPDPVLKLHTRTPDGFGTEAPLFELSSKVGDVVAIHKANGTRVSIEKTVGASGRVFFSLSDFSEGGGVTGGDDLQGRIKGDNTASGKSYLLTMPTVDTTDPTLEPNSFAATVNSTYLTVTFSEELGYVDGSKFTVTGGTVRYVRVLLSDPKKVQIVLTSPVTAKAYTVSWTAGAVMDQAGNEVAEQAVALEVTGSADSSDDTGPVLIGDGASGSSFFPVSGVKVGSTYVLTVFFDEVLKTGATAEGRLTVGTGNNIRLYKLGASDAETLVLSSTPDGVSFEGSSMKLTWNTVPSDALVKGDKYRLKIKADTVEDSGDNGNGEISYDFVHGVLGSSMFLSTEGDGGLSIIDFSTLRVNFRDNVALGYYKDRVTLEKKNPVNVYEKVDVGIVAVVDGKGFILKLDGVLDDGGSYRVKIDSFAVKKAGEDDVSGDSFETEAEKVDFVAPTLDTLRDGGLTVGENRIRVYFSEKMGVKDSTKIKVVDEHGDELGIWRVRISDKVLDIQTTKFTDSATKYKVVFESGAVEDTDTDRNDGLPFVGETVFERPVSDLDRPSIKKIFVRQKYWGEVEITFDKDITLLNYGAASFYSTFGSDVWRYYSEPVRNFRVEGDTVKFSLGFPFESGETSFNMNLDEGFVGSLDHPDLVNPTFSIRLNLTGIYYLYAKYGNKYFEKTWTSDPEMNLYTDRTGLNGLHIDSQNSLRIIFKDSVKLGSAASTGITIEKKTGVDSDGNSTYEAISNPFTLSTSGSTLKILLRDALESSSYRVKLAANAIRKEGVATSSPKELTTETDLFDPLLIDTTQDGGVAAGDKLIKVFFNGLLKLGVNTDLKHEVTVKDREDGEVELERVVLNAKNLEITTKSPLDSSKQYKVEIKDGTLKSTGGILFGKEVVFGIPKGVTSTSFDAPSAGNGPVVSDVSVSTIRAEEVAAPGGGTVVSYYYVNVTVNFDQEIKLLDANKFSGKIDSGGTIRTFDGKDTFTVTADGSGDDTQLTFVHRVAKNTGSHNLDITLGEGLVSKKDDDFTWNKAFTIPTITGFTAGAGATWSPTPSLDDDADLLGFSSFNFDTVYGF
jgi:hypothetical protein